MMYNRAYLKASAKRRLKQKETPSITMVTLVFLLLYSLLDQVASLFYTQDSALMTLETDAELIDYDALQTTIVSYYMSSESLISMFCSIFMTFFCLMLMAGFCYYLMNLARNRPAGFSDLTYGLEILPKLILLYVIEFIFIFLWSILFVIPGIIAMCRYSMAMFILIDNPDISPMEAIRRSKAMMHGYKLHLVTFLISFIGWYILGCIPTLCGSLVGYMLGDTLFGAGLLADLLSVLLGFGLGLTITLWLTSYMNLSMVYFYEFVSSAAQQRDEGSSGSGGYGESDNRWDYLPSGEGDIPQDYLPSGREDSIPNEKDPWD